MKFLGLTVQKIWHIFCVCVSWPVTLTFDLLTLKLVHNVARVMGYPPVNFGNTTTICCRAMLCIRAAYAVMRCVCVCLSRSWIVSKRINIASKNFHRRVATSFQFFIAKRHNNIPTGTPLTGASNAGEVGKNCDSEPTSGLTACVNTATS